jgi:hypothetical protein
LESLNSRLVLTPCDPTADGIVDRSDIAILAQNFGGGDGAFDERADCNNDRALDLHDLWSIQKSQLDVSPPVATLDYGDAPAPYPTRVADDGAAHDTRGNDIFLGHRRDTDADGQPSYQALGDDVLDGDDDEDGVIFFSNGTPGWRQHLDVKASMNGSLDAWVDFNRDGRWDGHEQVFQSEQLVPGPNHLSFLVPADAIAEENVDQPTYARFRISSAGGLMPTGIARDGEVEDHAYTIVPSLGGSPKPAAASALVAQRFEATASAFSEQLRTADFRATRVAPTDSLSQRALTASRVEQAFATGVDVSQSSSGPVLPASRIKQESIGPVMRASRQPRGMICTLDLPTSMCWMPRQPYPCDWWMPLQPNSPYGWRGLLPRWA